MNLFIIRKTVLLYRGESRYAPETPSCDQTLRELDLWIISDRMENDHADYFHVKEFLCLLIHSHVFSAVQLEELS